MSSLRQNKGRSIFTMLGIIIGITSVVTVVSLGEGLKHQIVGQATQIGSNVVVVRPGKLLSKNSSGRNRLNFYAFLAPSTLTTGDVSSLGQLPLISSVAPIEFVTSSASSDSGQLDNVFVAGTSPSLANLLHQKITYGDFLSDGSSQLNFAVVGSDVAANLFGVLNPVGETVHIMGQDFIIHGVLAPSAGGLLSVAQADYNSSIFIPTGAAENLTGGRVNILQVLVKAKTTANIDSVVNSINAVISKNHGGASDFTILKQDQLLGVTNQVLNSAASFVTGIAAISLIVGGIGIMDIMLLGVNERTREIGIRKAIGATNRQIMRHFLTEGLVLTIVGGLIGIVLSFFINLLLRLYTNWEPIISPPIVLLAVAVSIAAGLIFSLFPALKAARKDPITALRGE